MKLVGSLVDRAMFPGTEPSYDMASFEELFFLSLHGRDQKVPCVLFPYYKGSEFLIVYAHGNGSDVGDILGRLERLSCAVQAHVLGFDYPGYGCASGQADVAAVDEVLSAVMAFVCGELRWPLENVVLFGCSIGTGPCTRFARNVALQQQRLDSEGAYFGDDRIFRKFFETFLDPLRSMFQGRKLGGLILQCPYRSIRHAAERFIGKLMARVLVEARWDIEKEIAECQCPILWIHGKRDEMFDWNGSRLMYEQYCNNFKMIHVPEEATHLNFDFEADLVTPIRTFLTTLVATSVCPVPHFSILLHLPSERLNPPPGIRCSIPVIPSTAHHVHASVMDVLNTWIESPYRSRCVDAADSEEACEERRSFETMQRTALVPVQLLVHANEFALSDTAEPLFEDLKRSSSVAVCTEAAVVRQPRVTVFSKRAATGEGRNVHHHPRANKSSLVPGPARSSALSEGHFHKFWPWSRLKASIVYSMRFIGATLRSEVLLRNVLDYGTTERFVSAVHFVRRFYALRFRHHLGMDLIYKRLRHEDGTSYWGVYGIVIAGVLLQLNNGVLHVEMVPAVVGRETKYYMSTEYLVIPIFSPPKDFILALARWLVLPAAEHTRLAYDSDNLSTQLPHEPIDHLLADSSDCLAEFGSNYVYDFCAQQRRPLIERLGFEFGNYFPAGWESVLGKLLDDWSWFAPRIMLSGGSSQPPEEPPPYIAATGWQWDPQWLSVERRAPMFIAPQNRSRRRCFEAPSPPSSAEYPFLPTVAPTLPPINIPPLQLCCSTSSFGDNNTAEVTATAPTTTADSTNTTTVSEDPQDEQKHKETLQCLRVSPTTIAGFCDSTESAPKPGPCLILAEDLYFVQLVTLWMNRLDSRLLHPHVPVALELTPQSVARDRRRYVACCRQWDRQAPKKVSVCYHHIFHIVLLRPGFIVPEDFSCVDAIWRLAEVLTGVTCYVGKSSPLQTDAEQPSPDQAAFLMNLSVCLMITRRLLNLARAAYSATAPVPTRIETLLVVASTRFPPMLYKQYPGITNPCIRLLDELRFSALRRSLREDSSVMSSSFLGYQQDIHGWQGGSMTPGSDSYLIAQLENLLAILFDALEAVDSNTPLPLASARPIQPICNYIPAEVIVKLHDHTHLHWTPAPLSVPYDSDHAKSPVRRLQEIFVRYLLTQRRSDQSVWWRNDFSWVSPLSVKIRLPPRPVDIADDNGIHTVIVSKEVEHLETHAIQSEPFECVFRKTENTQTTNGESNSRLPTSNALTTDSSTSDRACSDFASADSWGSSE